MPACTCGGPLKPATISFGQSLVRQDLDRSLDAASRCDLFVAVGTSLVVGPINQMFAVAAGNGATTAILTNSETPYDEVCNFKLTAPVERTLPEVLRLVGDA